MDFAILPGPSLPERARTALARASVASVCIPRHAGQPTVEQQIRIRAGRDGSPLLLPATGSSLQQRLAVWPGPVTVSVPADAPFRALQFAGCARQVPWHRSTAVSVCRLDLASAVFTGSRSAAVPLDDYRAAAPDPLWRVAPGILHHLEHSHMTDLVGCVRAHGMSTAEWVIPRGLDRYGLELHVLGADGAAQVRLSFPDGPVASLHQVPGSILATLTCRCQAPSGRQHTPPDVSQ